MEDLIASWLGFNLLLVLFASYRDWRKTSRWDRMNRAEGAPGDHIDLLATGSFNIRGDDL